MKRAFKVKKSIFHHFFQRDFNCQKLSQTCKCAFQVNGLIPKNVAAPQSFYLFIRILHPPFYYLSYATEYYVVGN